MPSWQQRSRRELPPMSARLDALTADFAPMSIRDVPRVGIVERRNYDFPWTDGIFRDCVKAGYHCRCVFVAGELVGHGVLQIAADEAHILNLCIDQGSRHRGLGRQLLEHLVSLAQAAGAGTVFLEVRPSNPRAQEMYLAAGFNEVGQRPGYYDSHRGREDAIVMACAL